MSRWTSYIEMSWFNGVTRVYRTPDLAWSRDQEHKVYVQDWLYANGRDFRWIEAGAVIYVCGDKQRMAKDVE